MIPEPASLDIGSVLAEGRKRTGRSLELAAEQTRIRKVYLESLEANRFEDLPGRAYVVGFMKVYARYLAIDAEPLLAAYYTKTAIEPAVLPSLKMRPLSGKMTRPLRSGRGLFIIGFTAVLLVGLGVYFLPALWTPSAPVLPPEPAAVVQKTSPAGAVEQNDMAVSPVVSDPVAPVLAPAPPGESPSAEPPVEAPAMVTAEPALPVVAQNGSILRMLAITRGALIIQVDGRPSQRYSLREGLDLTWPVNMEVTAELGAPGQVRFWLDQVELILGERTTFHLRQAQEN